MSDPEDRLIAEAAGWAAAQFDDAARLEAELGRLMWSGRARNGDPCSTRRFHHWVPAGEGYGRFPAEDHSVLRIIIVTDYDDGRPQVVLVNEIVGVSEDALT